MDIALSVNKVPIRLTEERWVHIVENHNDLAGHCDDIMSVVENPNYVVQGYGDALIALRKINGKHLSVVYKETSRHDGFIITAYFTRSVNLSEENVLWPK